MFLKGKTMKRLLILVLMLCVVPVYASAPTRVYTYTAGNVIQPSEVTANEDAIFRYLTAGVDTIAANSVGTSQLIADSVTTAKILDGTIVSADISATAAIPYSKLTLTGLVATADLSNTISISTSGTITTTNTLQANAVTCTTTTTTSGLSVTGMVKDKDGDWPAEGQILVGGNTGVNWEAPPALGAWDAGAPWVSGTAYLAATDGFVVAYTIGAQVLVQTDSANPPTTSRTAGGSDTTSGGACSPVKKGEYWKVTGGTIYWIPLGN